MKTGLALATLVAATSPALAHVGHGSASGFAAGLAHPILGIDHLLAMFAVGVWAVVAGGKATLMWPGAFLSGMVLGSLLALGGVALPMVEPAILASLIVVGAALARALPVSLWSGASALTAFGMFHGHAHLLEIPTSAAAAEYAAGFLLATAGLHAAGAAVALVARGASRLSAVPRALGWVVVVAGAALGFA
ncbi:HupE/UreJ family protein [Lutibaculum baratangense]|nr:HupE/UreJ family protein [Lutibaculum baratangense]